MDNKDFILDAFLGSYHNLTKIDLSKRTVEVLQSRESALIPLIGKEMDFDLYIRHFFEKYNIYSVDAPKLEILLDFDLFYQQCIKLKNGPLFTFRRVVDGTLQWTRLLLSTPTSFSEDNHCVMFYSMTITPTDADRLDAVRAVEERIEKIIKCNLSKMTFDSIKIHKSEEYHRNLISDYSDILVEEEFVHPDDINRFRYVMNYDSIIEHFKYSDDERTVIYRRKTGSLYKWVKLVVVKSSEYSADTPIFIYMIVDVHKTVINFYDRQARRTFSKESTDLFEKSDTYYENLLNVTSFFTQSYTDFYMVDLERDQYIKYKIDRNIIDGDLPYTGSYSEMTNLYITTKAMPEQQQYLRKVDTADKLRAALINKASIDYTFIHVDGKPYKTICTKLEAKDEIPIKVICRTLPVNENQLLKVKTFGNFEVYDESGAIINFTKAKGKQLFAYLIDKHGYPVSTAEIIEDVLEKPADDLNAKKYVSTLFKSAAKDLSQNGYSDIIIKEYNSLRVNPDKIDCDYYHLIDGDLTYWESYNNEYMKEYSWAEETNAEILHYSSN